MPIEVSDIAAEGLLFMTRSIEDRKIDNYIALMEVGVNKKLANYCSSLNLKEPIGVKCLIMFNQLDLIDKGIFKYIDDSKRYVIFTNPACELLG